MLDAGARDSWIEANGPWFYWAVWNLKLWPWILRDGIQPQTESQQRGLHAELPSRPGHIYFLTDWIQAAWEAAGTVMPSCRVRIEHLELERLATDEDRVSAALRRGSQPEPASPLPGWDEVGRCPEPDDLGEWMNARSSVVDQTEWVSFSMRNRTVAYRGSVPRRHLEILYSSIEEWWEPAEPGEVFSEATEPAAHFIGPPSFAPT